MINAETGDHRCCNKKKVKRGLWSPEEDETLISYLTTHGHGSWSSIPKVAGLHRCGKSCRLRWMNYLKPDLKRGSFTPEEEQIIIDVHRIVGNKWAQIAKHLPGRTDNQVKNFWNSCIKKRFISQGLDPNTHNLISSYQRASSKNIASNLSQTHQQPISVFTLNSQITDASMEMKTPFVKIPKSPPPFLQTSDITTTDGRNPNVFWTVKCQSSNDFTSFPSGSSLTANISSSSSSSSLNPYGFGIMNHEGNAILEPFEAPRSEEVPQPRLDQNINPAFDSSNFDLGFMESTLMSEGLMDYDLSYMDDLAWN